MKQSNTKSQEARILFLLQENFGQWVPCNRVASPDDGPRILQYSRAISNLRHAKFDGKSYNIQNKTERQPDGEVHGSFRLLPGEYRKDAPVLDESPKPHPLKSWDEWDRERKQPKPELEWSLTP